MFHLKNKAQNYAWGRSSNNSLVYEFIQQQLNDSTDYSTDLPYAELWMGSHSKAESSVLVPVQTGGFEEVPLSKFMEDKFSTSLPYLFKILSIEKCLSIQAHPGKELAAILHANNPDKYPDANHKPEMAIALTKFQAFSNFAPAETIISNLTRYKQFSATIEQELATLQENIGNEEIYSAKLKELFLAVHKTTPEMIGKLVEEAQNYISSGEQTCRDEHVVKLHSQFGEDIGILVTLMLNYLELEPGQSFVMNPKEPHAYFGGEIFERKHKFIEI